MLGSFLADARRRLEAALDTIPGATLSYLEITLYPKEEEEPREEYNLSCGEVGKRLFPDAQIPETPDEEKYDGEEDKLSDSQQLVKELVFAIRKELADIADVSGFGVGVRTLVTTTNPGTTCCGSRCEFNFAAWDWRVREFYWKKGKCRKRWTDEEC